MHRLFPRALLLILALVASQWLTLAHASMHPALADDLHCEMCVHGVGLGTALPSKAVLNGPTIAQHEPPAPQPGAAPRQTAATSVSIRGPPADRFCHLPHL